MTPVSGRPTLLDLFCGGGGAAMGYYLAGFDVIGVDCAPQPSYPFPMIVRDAMAFPLGGFDAIHASPPCQGHSPTNRYPSTPARRRSRVDLIPALRDRLLALRGAIPWVIENVATSSAALREPALLCGAMFGLPLYRHRHFESPALRSAMPPEHLPHAARCTRNGYLPTPERPYMTITGRNGHHSQAWTRAAADAMGTPWLARDLDAVCEAIPPAYTRWVGERLMRQLA